KKALATNLTRSGTHPRTWRAVKRPPARRFDEGAIKMTTAELSRRQFLKGTGALIVSFNLFPSTSDLFAQSTAAPGGEPDPTQLDSWIAVASDGTVTVFTSKVELGTGIETAPA